MWFKLKLENSYNLNVIKEIRVTDSFLSMDKDIKGCQKESYDDCTRRKYLKTLINRCQCLPFHLNFIDQEIIRYLNIMIALILISI